MLWRAVLTAALACGVLGQPGSSTPASYAQSLAGGCDGLQPVPPLIRADATSTQVICLRKPGDLPVAVVVEQLPGPPAASRPLVSIQNRTNAEVFRRTPDRWVRFGDLSELTHPNSDSVTSTQAFPVDFQGTGEDWLVVTVLTCSRSCSDEVVSVLPLNNTNTAVALQENPRQSISSLSHMTVASGITNYLSNGNELQIQVQGVGQAPNAPARPSDPLLNMCERIGWNPASQRVEVLDRVLAPCAPLPTDGRQPPMPALPPSVSPANPPGGLPVPNAAVGGQAKPSAPQPWPYVPFQVDPAQEQAFRDAVTALATTDSDHQHLDEALDATRDGAPEAYRFLIRASRLPRGDPAALPSSWWRDVISGGVDQLSLLYHEYTHSPRSQARREGCSVPTISPAVPPTCTCIRWTVTGSVSPISRT